MRYLGGCILLLVGVTWADATGCVVRARVFYPSYAPVYHAPVAVAKVVAVPYPVYTAHYGPGQETQQLLAELRALRQEVSVLRSGQVPQGANVQPQRQPEKAPPPEKQGATKEGDAVQGMLKILTDRCATCHTGQGKGGLTLFVKPGQMAALHPAQIGEALRRLMLPPDSKDRMPPAPHEPLNDKDFSEVNFGFATLLAQTPRK